MQPPDNRGVGTRYLSLAPSTTAQFFRLNPELQGPVANLCSILGQHFPGSQISITAVHSYTVNGLMLVVGVSTQLNEESSAIVMSVMEDYFQPILDRMGLERRVMVALGDGLGSHYTDENTARPLEVIANIEDKLDDLSEAGPLGYLMATSLPIFERGKGDDLARVFKAANTATEISSN
jgi:hypothetical protein